MEVVEYRNYVLFRIEECNSIKDLEYFFEEIYFLCNENDYNRIIIDLSGMKFRIRNDLSKRFHLGQMTERYFKFNNRIGIVLNSNKIESEIQDVASAQSRGVNVGVFSDVSGAEDWVLH